MSCCVGQRDVVFVCLDGWGGSGRGDVLVGAVTSDCGDAGAVHLRDRVGQAVGHYAIDGKRGSKKQPKKQTKKNNRCQQAGLSKWGRFFWRSVRDEGRTARGVS